MTTRARAGGGRGKEVLQNEPDDELDEESEQFQFWGVMLAYADQRGDLRPLAQVLEARIPLPDWVLADLVAILRKRRLRPPRPMSDAFKRAAVLAAKNLYDKSKRPGETAAQRVKRVVQEFNDAQFKGRKHRGLRVTEAALTNLVGGRSRLARAGQRRRKAERR